MISDNITVAELDPITEVSVVNLFGKMNHNIPVNLSSGITILHGSNGIGKTTILTMIREVMNLNPIKLNEIPFDRFSISFKSGDSISITQNKAEIGDNRLEENELTEYELEGTLRFSCNLKGRPYNGNFIFDINQELIDRIKENLEGSWIFTDENEWMDMSDGEVISTEDLVHRHHFPMFLRKKILKQIRSSRLKAAPTELQLIKKKCRVRFIDTRRLLPDISQLPDSNMLGRMRESKPTAAVQIYSRRLRSRIRKANTEYSRTAISLDRSRLKRLIDEDYEELDALELSERMKEQEKKSKHLTRLGLFSKSDSDYEYTFSDDKLLSKINDNASLFSLVVEDTDNKLKVYDYLSEKLTILEGRTNDRFIMKRLKISAETGITFELQGGDHREIKPQDLSSGEQHQFILFYELIFGSRDGDLILFDEPELSLHLEWQIALLDDLRSAFDQLDVNVILATHSPAIINNELEYLVHLSENNNDQE